MKTVLKFTNLTLIILLLSLLFDSSNCQAQQHSVNNISIPTVDGGGSLGGDIIKAGDYFCVYAFDKVIVYDNTGNYAGEVIFNPDEDYGKFNPFYYWDSRYTNSTSLMAYNETSNVFYTISPDLKIYIIDLNPNTFLNIIDYVPDTPVGEPTLYHFKPLHGNCILKYDKHHDRLFWVIDGRNQSANSTGSFHVRQRYIFIFDINNLNQGQIIDWIYADHEYSNTLTYGTAGILDMEINEINVQSDPDYFYLSKINHLEVWEISKDNTPVVSIKNSYEIPDNYGCDYYKMMLKYINDQTNGIHRIIAYQYRLPFCGPLSDPEFFVLDGNHANGNIIWDAHAAPNGKITDAAYLKNYKHLIFSHSADPLNTVIGFDPDHDISIYQFSDVSNSLSFHSSIETDESLTLPTQNDFNTPISIVPVSKSAALLCKEDEISYLHMNNNEYESTSILSSENNFFIKGISYDNGIKAIVNATKNGVQIVSNNYTPIKQIESGYQVNHICMDSDGDKFYLFNKLNTYKTGCIVLEDDNAVNLNNNLTQVIEAPVGDCIYNPFLDHFLISENATFELRAASVKVFLNNTSNSFHTSISLESGFISSSFARDMFISPDGKLFVAADMNCNALGYPKVYIFDATDDTYPLLSVCSINNLNHSRDNLEFYKAYFCYNHHNNRVYATINPQLYVMSPYNASSNGLMGHFYDESGLFIEFDDNNSISTSIPLTAPGKIICPENPDMMSESGYDENMYIIGRVNFYEILPPYNNIENINASLGNDFVDITYSRNNDKLFALNDSPYQTTSLRHRIMSVYAIDYAQGDLEFTKVLEEGGQASCIISNPFNNEIYVQQKTDEYKLGETPVSMLYFEYDPGIVPPNLQNVQSIDLGINSVYPEIDHNDDFGFYLYNITTPLVNPFDNAIYFPNGGHSSVSKITFDAEEKLALNSTGITWLSFPRLNRDPATGNMPAETALNDRIAVELGEDDGGEMKGQNGDLSGQLYIDWEWNVYAGSGTWEKNDDYPLDDVNSKKGYILELQYDNPPAKNSLTLLGDLMEPDAEIDLYCQKDNWVGYFLYEEQSAFDALADVLDELYHIKGQTFNCYRYNYPLLDCEGLKSYKDVSPGTWICNGKPNINYGDMIMIKPEQDTEFQWNYAGNPPSNLDVPKAEYFDYDEKANYTTLVLELDTSITNPDEIGAFVNDTCVGACTVNELDSVVVLSAYLEQAPGDSVTFEQYYASAKSTNAKIREYFVLNTKTQRKEKRVVKTGENQDVFIVSFRDETIEEDAYIRHELNMHLYPNPATSIVNIEYSLMRNTSVRIVMLDVLGKQIAELQNEHQPQGIHTYSLNVKNINGHQLLEGVYFIQLTADGQKVVEKLIIN